jgi:uncharacterized protein YndB with AHSA1/START domain
MSTEDRPDARVVRVEVEVPGTPEEVWEAIATGPGIETWFVPAEVEEREGGSITTHHGPYGDSTGVITAWEPPRRFAYEERDWKPEAPDAPPWATEILVEARAGGTCVVRLASGLFSNATEWADEIEGTESGWDQALENLRLYLTHFRGERCATLFVTSSTSEPPERALPRLTGALGLADVRPGDRVSAPADAPPLRGVVERVADEFVVVRADEPIRGLLELAIWAQPERTEVMVRGYLYGEGGPSALERAEPAWREWLDGLFPSAQAA